MESAAYLDFLRADGEALAAAARSAPGAPVASCPGWDMTALVAHTGGVHHWVDEIFRSKAVERINKAPAPDGFDATLAWYERGLSALLATLAAADPEEALWNWRDRGAAPAAFWYRRMAQETAIHRWDGEDAAAPGGAHPVAVDLAVDGIDEYLSFVALWLPSEPVEGLQGSMHLHATDADGEWWVDLRPDGLEVRREHRKADVALQAPASDLYLFLLNRAVADGPTMRCFGDDAILRAWRRLKF